MAPSAAVGDAGGQGLPVMQTDAASDSYITRLPAVWRRLLIDCVRLCLLKGVVMGVGIAAVCGADLHCNG
jgi:hypothetical protein